MKAQGKDWKYIAEVFGLKDQTEVLKRIALGNIPELENIGACPDVSLRDAEKYLLPLRIETGRNPDNGKERIYDYIEVQTAIWKLTNNKLTKEDLPTYSAERRLAIQQDQQDARLKKIAEQKVVALKQQLSEKDSQVKQAQSALATETKRVQGNY